MGLCDFLFENDCIDNDEVDHINTILTTKKKKNVININSKEYRISCENKRKKKIKDFQSGLKIARPGEIYSLLKNDIYTEIDRKPEDIEVDSFGNNTLALYLKCLEKCELNVLFDLYEVIEAIPDPHSKNKLGQTALDFVNSKEILFLIYFAAKRNKKRIDKIEFKKHYSRLKNI